MGMDVDVKGEIYEGLLQKNAEDVKGGAGQYFTPRPLIKAMVEVMRPLPGMVIGDPACGTGGFFLGVYDYITNRHDLDLDLDRDQKHDLRYKTFLGTDIVEGVARLCVMNLYLHGIEPVKVEKMLNDSLRSEPSDHVDLVLTNPPFGKKSSITVFNGEGKAERETLTYNRQDFWATTSNKQLNFLQHVRNMLKIGGGAAIVVPDNVLFEGGAGETVRRSLLLTSATSTHCSGFPPAYSTPRVSRPTSSSSTGKKPAKPPGLTSSGSTIFGRTSTSRSRQTPSGAKTSKTSSSATTPRTGTRERSLSDSGHFLTMNLCSGTRRTWTYSG